MKNVVRAFRSMLLFVGLVATVSAQPTLTIIDWIPAGLTLTQGPSATLQYEVGGTANLVNLTFVRDDGTVVSVANVDPADPQPFQIDLPLPTNVDRLPVSYIGTVQDTITGEFAAGNRPAEIVVDDVGPNVPNITSPPLPHVSYSPTIELRGNADNTPAGGNTDIPETGGSVVIYVPATNDTIGGGIIRQDSSFIATVDMSDLDIDTMYTLNIHAVDEAGNIGTTGTIQLEYRDAPPPALSDLTMSPPDGTLTNNPGVVVSGTVTGDVPPFTVNVFVDGFIQSQIAGLENNESFNHTLTLPGEGSHTISVQATNANVPPASSEAEVLGTITLDRTPPGPPLITSPDPNVSPFVTNADSFTIRGLPPEGDVEILLSGPSGIVFNPPSPLILSPDGSWETEADISALGDGTYTITVTARDQAGNTGPDSSRQIIFVRDTTPPIVDEIRVDGVVAPQTNPEIYVGQTSVRISVKVNEDMPQNPSSTVTQSGYGTLPTGFSSSTLRVFEYVYGVIPGADGPVEFTVSGGADRAGNPLDHSEDRLFIVDTVPPRVVSMSPSDGTSVSVSPERIRVRFEDPLSEFGTASGMDLAATEIVVTGAVGDSNAVIDGALVPYDPETLDFVPAAPLEEEGIYRVTITAVDRVGNRSSTVTRTFILDQTPIRLGPHNVETNPPDGAYVNAETMPGTAATPFVEAFITDPQFDVSSSTIRVRDYCRVPPDVPGTQTTTGPTNLTYTFRDPLAVDGSQDGVYTIELDVRDHAGNESPTYVTTFTYDTRPPRVDATFPAHRETVRGPLRIVDATLVDPRVDPCRRPSGIDRNQSTLELWLTQPNEWAGNTTEVPYQVPGTLRFISVGEIDRVLLEIVDENGIVVGLPTDGSADGTYELRVEAVDRAANRSGITTTSFVYDTQRPRMSVDALEDGVTLTAPLIEFTGTAQDNRGGSGINRVEVTLREVDGAGFPTTTPAFFDRLQASLDPLGLGPFDPSPPKRTWRFSGAVSGLTTSTRSELLVRAYDEGGNSAEERMIVQLRPSALPAPTLSSPAGKATTSAQTVTFSWNRVEGARGYQLRIITPNGNEIYRDTGRDVLSASINLASYPDGEGTYLWAVASKDATGRLGPWSQNRSLIIDRTAPRVVAVDVYDPSPEGAGAITAGEARFTIRFSEPMDTSKPLTVRLHPENDQLPPLEVSPMSYIGDTWTGRVIVPEGGNTGPDYNGLAVLSVTGGYDRSGLAMLPPHEGFTVIEIDTGPYFKLATFVSPLNERDIILVVKGTRRLDGPTTRLIEPLTVVVRRAGQQDQTPTMHRMGSGAFRGSFILEPHLATDLQIQISGRNERGNTATRTTNLTVRRITASGGGIVINESRSMIVSAGPGAVEDDRSIFLTSARQSLVGEGSNVVGRSDEEGELVVVATLGAVEPQGLTIPGGLDLVVDLEKVAADTLPEVARRAGIYRLAGDRWKLLPGSFDGRTLTGRLDTTSSLAIMADVVPPRLDVDSTKTADLFAPTADGSMIIPVVDDGSGVDPDSLRAEIGRRVIPVRWDDSTESIVIDAADLRAIPGGEMEIRIADRAGNTAVFSGQVEAQAAPSFLEAVAFPNPARSFVRIRYRLSAPADEVRLTVFDTAGRRVGRWQGPTTAGSEHDITWELRDSRNRHVANGVYVARLTGQVDGRTFRRDLKVAVLR